MNIYAVRARISSIKKFKAKEKMELAESKYRVAKLKYEERERDFVKKCYELELAKAEKENRK